MIRAGARAPQPPPLPSSPTSPTSPARPHHNREVEQTKERLLHRVRQTENLREKVVKLARRQEEKIEQGEVFAAAEPSLVYLHSVQVDATTGQILEHGGAEVLVYDLKKGDGCSKAAAPVAARSAAEEDGKTTTIGGMKSWKRVTLTDLNYNSPPDSQADRQTQQLLSAETPQRPPPDSPPLPRSAARRLRFSSHQEPPATNSVHQPQKSILKDQSAHDRGGDPQQEGEGRRTVNAARPTANTNTNANATVSQTTPRSLRTPSRIVLNQGPSDVENVQDQSLSSVSPRSQDVHRQPRSPPGPPPRPGQGFNYRRAARLLQANVHRPKGPGPGEPYKRERAPLGQERRGPRAKSVKVRAEECSSHYQSSGSSADSPRQTSRGPEEAVGVLRGNAVPSSPHRLHAPVSPSRQHNKNPSNFASSLEMFKRRLKMNQSKLTKEEPEVEEDYVIRLADTVPVTRPLSYDIQHRPPDTPVQHPSYHPPRHPPQHPSYHPPRHPPQHPAQQPLQYPPPPRLDLGAVEDKIGYHLKINPAGDRFRDERVTSGDKRLADLDKGQGDLNKGLGDWDKGLEDWDKGLGDRDKELGERSAGDGQEAAEEAGEDAAKEEEEEEEVEEDDFSVSGRVPDSADDLPFVLIGETARTPLPKVKTYVVEEDASRSLQGRGHDLPLALTQHNVTMHNTFLQRRLERERQRQQRAELEGKAGHASAAARGGGGGGGMWAGGATGNPDAEWRMRCWLVETEQQQRDLRPLINFKLAIPTA